MARPTRTLPGIGVAVAAAAIANLAGQSSFASARTVPTPVNHLVNDRSGDPPGRVQSEVSLAAHDSTIVVIWNDSIGHYEDASLCGYGVSLDGGLTWRDGGELPNAPEMRVAGDPWTVATPGGEIVVASVDVGNDDGIALHRGRREGGTFVWHRIATYVRGGGEALDKPAIDYDPSTGVLYLAYTNWSQNRGELARSIDLGRTWSEPIVVFESSRATGYVPVADGRGRVHVGWVERIGQPSSELFVRTSADGGADWRGPPVRLATLGPHAHEPPLGYDRAVNATFLSLDVRSARADDPPLVLAAWTDGEPGAFDVLVSRSLDGGRTWTPAVRPRDAGASDGAFWPRVRAGTDGRVVVGWYDRRGRAGERSVTGFFVAASLDGGATFGPDHPMSSMSVPWAGVEADFTPNFGDYVDLVLDDHSVIAAWSDARAGDPDVIVARRSDRLTIDGRYSNGARGVELPGVAWPLGGGCTIQNARALTCAEATVVMIPLAFLASTARVPSVLPSSGGSATGVVRLTTDTRVVLQCALSISVPDQLASSGPPVVAFELTRAPSPSLSSASTAADRTHRWRTTLIVAPLRDALAISGRVDTAQRAYGVEGLVRVDASPVAGHHRRLIQDAWWEDGALRARAVVGDEAAPSSRLHDHAGDVARDVTRLDVRPNPVSGLARVHIRAPETARAFLRVYDVLGRAVRVQRSDLEGGRPWHGSLSMLDARGAPLAPGVYFVRLETEARDVLATTKVVVGQ